MDVHRERIPPEARRGEARLGSRDVVVAAWLQVQKVLDSAAAEVAGAADAAATQHLAALVASISSMQGGARGDAAKAATADLKLPAAAPTQAATF